MKYKKMMEQFGTKDVTATFGVAPPNEIVGPLKPKAVHYGIAFGSDPDDGTVFTNYTVPLLFLEFNKYRPDLPPWRNVKELVLAGMTDDGPLEVGFINTYHRSTSVTGDLKTIAVSGEGPFKFGNEMAIIDRDEVAKARDMTTVDSGSEFKVEEELV